MANEGDRIQLRLGSYRLQQRIAASTYGEVWRAEAEDGQLVALKLIHTARMRQTDEAWHARWINAAHKEILFLRSLSPWDERHIVRLMDDGLHDGLPVLALELMASDLAQYLRQKPATPLARCLQWLAQINQALAKMHQVGWRYLDLKPANLLLSHDGNTLKLADFGTSRRNPRPGLRLEAQQRAARHAYRGTANWQAPEQFFPLAGTDEDGQFCTDTRTDYFALGALFYYLITQGLPLRFCSLCGQLFKQQQGTVASQTALPPTLYPDEEHLFMNMIDSATDQPGTLARAALALLKQLLAPCPQQRPAHALAIARQIDGLLAKVHAS